MATEAPFLEQEYLDRYRRAQALMERDGLDALVVSEKNNYWYFSGLISYQLDHIQRPQICYSAEDRQAALAGLRQRQSQSQSAALGRRACAPTPTCPFLRK